jgi:hypothetical protein
MAQEFRRRYVLQQHIHALRLDIAARESRIQELQRLREYVATDAYVERVAREKFNYQKPGERVVVVPQAPRPSPAALLPNTEERSSSPARAWFFHLFGPSPTPRAHQGAPPQSNALPYPFDAAQGTPSRIEG